MGTDAYIFGVSEFTTWPWSFEHDVGSYASHGIDAIEITEAKLDRERYAEQLALVAAHDLSISSVQATIHSLYPTKLQPEPLAAADRLRHVRASIERIAPHVPAGTPFVIITGAPPDGNIAHVMTTAVDGFTELARCAEANGVRVALEPLNPSLMNVDSAVCELRDALDLVERVDHPAFGLCVDTWNIWQSQELDATLSRAADRIFLVQVSDWRTPREYYDRLVPGTGEIPLVPLITAVRRSGYLGPYVVEIFSSESIPDSLWRSNLDDVLNNSIVGFEDIWRRTSLEGAALR